MSEQFLMWVEIIFDVLYLATIWVLVVLMRSKRSNLLPENRRTGRLFIWAFFLLALGDTGHVGFRVIAYLSGGLEANAALTGIGSFATAVTVTFFYMLVTEIWRVRFDKKRGFIWWSLMVVGIARLIIMLPAGNQWGGSETPLGWSLARNIPLMIQGLAVAVLILVDGIKRKDRFATKVSIFIFISYACYIPVILFARYIPALGMLMMPKTLAYLAVAFLAFSMFRTKSATYDINRTSASNYNSNV